MDTGRIFVAIKRDYKNMAINSYKVPTSLMCFTNTSWPESLAVFFKYFWPECLAAFFNFFGQNVWPESFWPGGAGGQAHSGQEKKKPYI